ncbi:hypothetical protein Tco_0845209 [Tanacetum coccineum]
MEASVDRLLDEGGSVDQWDSVTGGGQETETKIVTGVRIVSGENVVTEKPKHLRKKRQAVTDASGSSHPPKKLRGTTELLVGPLLAVNLLSATLEHESGAPADSITGLNLRTIGASERFVISSDSSHHSSTKAFGAEADSVIRSAVVPLVMTEVVITSHAVNAPSIPVPKSDTKIPSPVHASMFHDSDSTKMVKAYTTGPSYFAIQDLSMGSRELNSETLHQVFVPQWNVLNDSLLDDYDVSREFVDHLAPPALISQIRKMDYHHLFTEFNVGTARQACLNAEVRMRTEYCLSERKRLESECEKQADLLKVAAAEATEKMHVDEIDALKQRNVVLKSKKESLDGKVAELQSSVSTKDLELKDLNVVVSSLRSQKDSLVDQVSGYEQLKEQIKEFEYAQMNIVNNKVAKLEADLLEMAFHLEEKFYPHLLTTISGRSRAIEKGMQDGLSAGIDHGKAGMSLADIVAYNLATKADYNSALQRLHEPDVEQLTLPIRHPEDQVVLGETSLSFDLSVTHSQVERIMENVAAQRSALIDVWVPLVDPLSAKSLIGEASTSGSVPAAVVTTIAISSGGCSGKWSRKCCLFPTVEFEKEELDTTPERDPPS